jgi:hypothetical protein
MSNSSPPDTKQTLAALQALGTQLRAQRKALKVNATVAAEAAGISRVTLRTDKQQPCKRLVARAHCACRLSATQGFGMAGAGHRPIDPRRSS